MSKKLCLLLIVAIALAAGCAGRKVPTTKAEVERVEREAAFPDMSYDSQSPKRKASLELTQQGYHDYTRGMYAGASKKFEQAIDLDPSNPYAFYHYGISRSRQKEYDQSNRLLDEARDKFGDNFKWQSRILNYQGQNYEGAGEIEKARELYRKALDLDSRNEEARANLERIGDE